MSYIWGLHSDPHFFKSVRECGFKKKPNGFTTCPCQRLPYTFISPANSEFLRYLPSSPEMERKIHATMCIPRLVGTLCAISRNGICLLPPQGWSSGYLAVVSRCLFSCQRLPPASVCSVISLSRPDYFEAKSQLSAFQA